LRQANNSVGGAAGWKLAGLVAVSLILYWSGNARTPLWDRDEPRFAEAAREMLETGDFIVPRFHGEIRPDKPILGYWAIAAGMKVFGAGEFGARFFSGVFGASCVVVLFLLARRMTGSAKTALAAAAMLAASPVMFAESKLCTVDAGLLFWLLLAFAGLWRIWEGPCKWPPRALFWAAVALGLLTKGPVALAAVFVPVLLMAVFAKDRSFLARMGWPWGVPLLILICLPWAWAVQARTGGEFLRLSLGRHVVERARRALEGHSGFPGFYAATLFFAFFPWAFFVPGAVWSVFGGIREKKMELFLLSWGAGLIIVLELVRTKMVHYSLPAFPALAVLVALFLESQSRRRRLVTVGAVAALAMALILGAGAPVALHLAGMDAAVFPMACAGALLAVGMTAALLAARRERWMRAAFAAAAAWLFACAAWGLPAVGRQGSTPALLESVALARSAADVRGTPVSIGYREPSLVFYLGGDVLFLDGPGDLAAVPVQRPPRVVIADEDAAAALGEARGRRVVERDSARGFNFATGQWENLKVYIDYGD